MTDPNHDKKLDEFLDSMLAAYSQVEPRPGLEGRILAGLHEAADRPASAWWRWKWLWTGAAVAAALLLLVLWVGRHPAITAPKKIMVQTPQPAQSPAPSQVQSPVPPQTFQSAKRPPAPRVRPQEQTAALRLSQRPPIFPTPTPLSEQEQLMFRYLAATPRKELVAQSRPDEPSVIAEDQSGPAVPDLVFVPQKSAVGQFAK